jgi:hypothetical protein
MVKTKAFIHGGRGGVSMEAAIYVCWSFAGLFFRKLGRCIVEQFKIIHPFLELEIRVYRPIRVLIVCAQQYLKVDGL